MLTLESLAKQLANLEAQVAALSAAPAPKPHKAETLPPVDLSGPYSDPVVKKDPSRWKGKSCVGLTLSQCPVDFLRVYAEQKQWQAGKNDEEGEEKYARSNRFDAAKALAWIERIEGKSGGNDEIPF